MLNNNFEPMINNFKYAEINTSFHIGKGTIGYIAPEILDETSYKD